MPVLPGRVAPRRAPPARDFLAGHYRAVRCAARSPAAHATTGVDVAPSAAAKGAGSEHVAGREVPGASGRLLEVWVKVRKGCGLRVGSEVRGGCARLLFSLRADRSSSSSSSSLTMPPGWRHGSVHDAQHIGSVDKPRERWAGARRQGRGSRGTWLRWRELCVLESNAGHCELQISGGMRVITRHSSSEIGRDAMALVSGKQGSWRPSRCQRGADTCRSARARSRRQGSRSAAVGSAADGGAPI